MQRSRHLTAAQTAILLGTGGLFLSLSFLIPAFDKNFHQSTNLHRTLLLLPPFLLGTALLLLSARHLKRGIQTRRWPSADIEALQHFTDSGLFRVALFACLITVALSLFWGDGTLHQLASVAYGPFLALTSLQTSLRNPHCDPNAIPTITSPEPAPLTSNHWGQ
jgi:hypothetical protein